LIQGVAEIRQDVALLGQRVEQLATGQQELIRKQEAGEERWRQDDRQTARELAAHTTALENLERMVARTQGWSRDVRARDTPPEGYHSE
jgi:hypothetical protein